ncbi:MAG TPA: divalent metal cation transporter [Terriglobales bacterium]|nr:divalent metal cation transporter [Terriglobales bacterium]
MAFGPSTQRRDDLTPHPPGPVPVERRKHDPELEERYESHSPKPVPSGVFRSLGLGLITGAADDDPVAIGTFATGGAKFGPALLWLAPVVMPMMFAVVYLSSKLGQVTGQGLFAVIRQHYPRWLLILFLATVLIGNTIEAGADIGGMAAALNLVVPIPPAAIVVLITLSVLALQIWGSYTHIRSIFRWLALALLAYFGSALLAHPGLISTLKGTFVPHIQFNRGFLEIVVAVIGSSLSAYLYTWQSNQEVEEDISMGRRRLVDRVGTTKAELSHSAHDVAFGMFFSSLVMYFVILSTGATLFRAGKVDINTAADAAQALRPLAGKFAELLFTIGVFGVGFIAVPVMTAGAAYDFCQTFGMRHGLHTPPRQARGFYVAIIIITAAAMGMNFLGLNPIRALVWAGIVQGLSTPFLMLLLMRMTNNRRIVGRWVNTRMLNILGWLTTAAIFAAAAGLIYFWIK